MQIETIIRSIVQDELAQLLREYDIIPKKSSVSVSSTVSRSKTECVSVFENNDDDDKIPF